MSRALLVLANDTLRAKAATWCAQLPEGTRVEFKGPKRTIPQNARMWAMLTDIAAQVTWHGRKLTTEQWKLLFLDSLRRENSVVPNLDGSGFANVGTSSSDLSKGEFGDLFLVMEAFGARENVVFHTSRKDPRA